MYINTKNMVSFLSGIASGIRKVYAHKTIETSAGLEPSYDLPVDAPVIGI